MADPDLQIRVCVCVGGGGGVGGDHADPEIRGVAVLKKNFSAPRASVWAKNKGGGSGPPPGPSPGSATAFSIGNIKN